MVIITITWRECKEKERGRGINYRIEKSRRNIYSATASVADGH
jgi:hypothetical protein